MRRFNFTAVIAFALLAASLFAKVKLRTYGFHDGW
jgi:hypothetical protein